MLLLLAAAGEGADPALNELSERFGAKQLCQFPALGIVGPWDSGRRAGANCCARLRVESMHAFVVYHTRYLVLHSCGLDVTYVGTGRRAADGR